jgi:hypothetical protein
MLKTIRRQCIIVVIDFCWSYLTVFPTQNKHSSLKNLKQIFEEHLNDQKTDMWCGITAIRIVKPIFTVFAVFTLKYMYVIVISLFRMLRNVEGNRIC